MEDLLPGLSEARLDALIAKALAGEADAAELFVLRRWLGEHGIDLSKTALPGGVTVLPAISSADITAAWTAVVKQVNHPALQSGIPTHTPLARPGLREWGLGTQPLRRGVWSVLAGCVAVMLMIVAGWHLGTPRLSKHRPIAMSMYVTGNGERANIILPDGSTVALNVASRLEVPVDYLVGNHTVRLTGEAQFAVPHHDGTSFTVLAGTAAVRVLGTSFLVRDYATDRVTTVAVRSGKVAVQTATLGSVVLTAARRLVIGRMGSGGVQLADPSQFSFTTGVLTLKSEPFPAAIAELDRWYDADIRLGDPVLQKEHLTGEYAAGSLTELGNILALTFNVRVVRNGRVLTLFPR